MGRAYEVRKASIQKSGATRGRMYTTFAKEIYLAAKKGGVNLAANDVLKRKVEKAKRLQIPNDIITRAIDKAKGVGGEEYFSTTYEGFGPGQSTFIIKCLTDNVNRTVGYIRSAFNKVNKSLGVTNSVSYNYDYLSVISFKCNDEEKVLDNLIANAIEPIDFDLEDEILTIAVNPSDEQKLKDVIENLYKRIEYIYDETGMFAKDKVVLKGEDKKTFEKLLNMLDAIEDVSEIYHNVEM